MSSPAPSIHADRILILDFGSQYARLIARRVREAGVYCELHPCDLSEAQIRAFAPRGIILSGGPETVSGAAAPRAPEVVFTLGVPVLGLCYGMQTMAAQLGGAVLPAAQREYGHARVRVHGRSPLLHGLEDAVGADGGELLNVWMSHGDRIERLPAGFEAIASSDNAPLAGMADEARRLYALQFHPEVTHTAQGRRIIARFLHDLCGCAALWTPAGIVEEGIAAIRAQAPAGRILLGLSGGVDSAVAAALLHRAVGDRLLCVFVDNGLLRLGEGDQVMATFARREGVRVVRVDAEQRFLDALRGVDDPERKRVVIGNLFVEIFEEAAEQAAAEGAASVEPIEWLAQGTIYPDVIESAGGRNKGKGRARVIKSHHNVGGLPERMRLKLLEPLRELFKDEVRAIGLELGLPAELINRHPFPGPGLGVRILGEVTKRRADLLRRADAIFLEELRRAGLYDRVAQAFAVFLPVRSVGVVGDARCYEPVVALRAVETVDFMTARWARLPYELLECVSNRIINEAQGVSRVVYDISGKPPATIEWE